MKILAVDTALGACSVAVLEDDAILSHRLEIMERGHAERLAPMAQSAMGEARIAMAALDRLAVTTGPGTFTGQRVGLAFMRGLRVALRRPLVGITTLDAMAAAARDEAHTTVAAVLHDAKRGEVYYAVVAGSGTIVAPAIADFHAAVAHIAEVMREKLSMSLAFAGTAGEAAVKGYRAFGGNPTITSVRQPDALWVARLAMTEVEPVAAPRPLYLRAPDAKLPAAGIQR